MNLKTYAKGTKLRVYRHTLSSFVIEMFDFLLIQIIQWRSHVHTGAYTLFLYVVVLGQLFFGFFGTRPNSTPFPVLAQNLLRYSPRNLPFFGTCPQSTLFWYLLEFYHFSVLARIRSLLRYYPEYDLFCLGFSNTHPDSIPRLSCILWYSSRYDLFFGTRLDTILSVLDSPVLARI